MDVGDSGPEPFVPSGNVVQFTPKKEYVWMHTEAGCDGQKFYLHRDGSVQCSACNRYVRALCWGKRDGDG